MAAAAVPLGSRPRSGGRLAARVDDDRLVAQVRAGDDRAFEAIYDRYYLGLLAFCRHMLGSRHEAEDALQHSFASAYRAIRGGAAVIELRPWLYTIARNRCLSALRSRREEVEVDGGHLDRGSLDGLGAQIQLRAELREMVDDLRRLPDNQRAALVLFELGDHSHEEIAAVLGVRREKVKALVFQARAALLRAREARDASCVDVREELASLVGALPARGMARAHVDRCPGCAAFEHDVRRQRRALAIILPVAPTVGLKGSVLGFVLGGGGGAAALTGAGAGGGATVAAGGALAAGGAGGAGAAGSASAVGVAGALGSAGAATVAGGLATGTAHVATGVAGATAKGLVAKILAVVAVAGGAGEATELASPTPLAPVVTASATPGLVGTAPRSGADTPSHAPPTMLGSAPTLGSQAAPAVPVAPASVPAADPAHPDPLPTAAPADAPAPVHVAPQLAPPAPTGASDPEPASAPDTASAPDPNPAGPTPDATTTVAQTPSATTTTAPPPDSTSTSTPPSATSNSALDATVTTTPEPSPAPSAAGTQIQE
jgi:RNA polymerase sigma factor (sigma-70 family)